MQRIEKETITSTRITHIFECDICKEEIGSSIEFDDGNYRELGSYEQKIFLDGAWYKLKRNLCDECATLLTKN